MLSAVEPTVEDTLPQVAMPLMVCPSTTAVQPVRFAVDVGDELVPDVDMFNLHSYKFAWEYMVPALFFTFKRSLVVLASMGV